MASVEQMFFHKDNKMCLRPRRSKAKSIWKKKKSFLLLKGIVSRDGLSTETIGVYCSLSLNNPYLSYLSVSVLHLGSRTSKIYDVTNRGTVDVKWRVLEYFHLLSSAVKCHGLPQQEWLLGKPLSSGLRIAKLRTQVTRNTFGKVRPVAIHSQI
jgi:hypothetical protein